MTVPFFVREECFLIDSFFMFSDAVAVVTNFVIATSTDNTEQEGTGSLSFAAGSLVG